MDGTPAEDVPVQELVGKRVAFRTDEDHETCWHQRVGLVTGKVLRPARTLAQKADMLRADGVEVPAGFPTEDVPRVWVAADACASMPNGCETAVELGCLLVG